MNFTIFSARDAITGFFHAQAEATADASTHFRAEDVLAHLLPSVASLAWASSTGCGVRHGAAFSFLTMAP